ncbi:DUF1674 domain-containing protein [Ponticaulis sp.]|uniref:DUF1674 domain-containing protein n=1 Tax=Ponticaulis sp. TaxID=2020902 RepID=UPI000B6AE461|nr:DUF1674 domain-containing protein [Ponticaulis sp.]MAI89881.1 DUF1674 domain-containing protein [Ponticaulis sp.]OUX99553.1 MAG: hypothetical protein CBB65_05525 [Hyphomonadaceae bacterium TMED5]|tara:strand:- start:1176 stop:1391 length:216 start_codon:yes stop_codon:yes gene_type:complete
MTDQRPLPENAAPDKDIPEDALRALEEAAERRREAEQAAQSDDSPKEYNGPRGLEPTRNGDWERKGIAYDF